MSYYLPYILAIACWLVHVWSPFGDSFGGSNTSQTGRSSGCGCQVTCVLPVPGGPWITVQVVRKADFLSDPGAFHNTKQHNSQGFWPGWLHILQHLWWWSLMSVKKIQVLRSTHTLIGHWIGKKQQHSTNVVNLLGEIMFFEGKLDVELQTQVLKLGLFCTKCHPGAILFETKMHCSTLGGVQVPGKWKNSRSVFNNLFFIFRGTSKKHIQKLAHLAHVMQSNSSKAVEPPIPFRSNHSKSTCLYCMGKCWYVEPSTATRARECSNLLQGIVLKTWMDESRWSFNHFFSTRWLFFQKVG